MSDEKHVDDGGPAFPPNGGWRDDSSEGRGMSLRDWFAGQALVGQLAAGPQPPDEPACTCEEYAESAYAYADAMLRARKVPVPAGEETP